MKEHGLNLTKIDKSGHKQITYMLLKNITRESKQKQLKAVRFR